MNMILRKRLANRRWRCGFTLVEVIVVLVILAILAAIAIPALTGYIDKAQDKQYIAEARNRAVALRAVLNDAYARGDFNGDSVKAFFQSGGYTGLATSVTDKRWPITQLGSDVFGAVDRFNYYREAAALIGEAYPQKINDTTDFNNKTTPYWAFHFIGPDSADSVAAADAFYCLLYPEGDIVSSGDGKHIIRITYKLDHIENEGKLAAFSSKYNNTSLYNPNAGYEVYHLIS
jgi:prepilin-type N-terminal cleavage/methylation domain-containing protein